MAIVVMLLGVTFYAFTISNLSSIMANLDTESNNYRRKVEALDEFSRENNLSQAIYTKMRRYFEYNYQTNANAGLTAYQKGVLLQELPPQLRTECVLFIHRFTITQIPFFNSRDTRFVAEVVQALQPMEIIAGEYVYKTGDYAGEMHFLMNGRAEIVSPLYEDTGDVLKIMVSGSFFGEDAIMNVGRSVSVRAGTACELQSWSRKSMREILKDFPSILIELKKIAREKNRRLVQKYEEQIKLHRVHSDRKLGTKPGGKGTGTITLANGLKRRQSFLEKTRASIVLADETEDDDSSNEPDFQTVGESSKKEAARKMSMGSSAPPTSPRNGEAVADKIANDKFNARLDRLEKSMGDILTLLGDLANNKVEKELEKKDTRVVGKIVV